MNIRTMNRRAVIQGILINAFALKCGAADPEKSNTQNESELFALTWNYNRDILGVSVRNVSKKSILLITNRQGRIHADVNYFAKSNQGKEINQATPDPMRWVAPIYYPLYGADDKESAEASEFHGVLDISEPASKIISVKCKLRFLMLSDINNVTKFNDLNSLIRLCEVDVKEASNQKGTDKIPHHNNPNEVEGE